MGYTYIAMSPEHARIFYVEDDPNVRETTEEALTDAGHEVVMRAANLQTALQVVPDIIKKRIDVAIVDGHLAPTGGGVYHGAEVVEAIRGIPGNSVYVIGRALDTDIPGTDMNVHKIEGMKALVQAVTQA